MTDTDPNGTEKRVRRLDDETVAHIAAGEVVTRPEDVVVELVENAVDAGATRVTVTIEGDGTDLLRVRDDGRGMSEADAALAVERHTTSKLGGPRSERTTANPSNALETVETLGFRGEALPSIAAAAGTLELVTNDGGPRGTRVRVGDGTKEVTAAGRARGTTVEVRDLFAEMPARRRSLASSRAEFARVSDAVSRYALVRPDVAFSLVHDGSEVFTTSGSGRYADAVLGVYDRDVAGQSTAFEAERTVEDDGEAVSVTVDGLLAYPSVTRARRDHVYTAVNGRAFPSNALRRAVVAGYGDLLPDGRAPVAVVRVSLPPSWADHNVHPAKREVRLRAQEAVSEAVRDAVSEALSTADLRRSGELAMDLETSLEPLSETESEFEDVTVIGQYRGLYVLCEADGELLVVDQHAAHERVNYERLRAATGGAPESAAVEPPATVTLSPALAATAAERRDELAALGYDIDPFGGGTVRVSAVPAPMGRAASPESVRDALDALSDGETPDDGREEMLKDLACHPSLKAGEELTNGDATALLERLGACERPYACPHGRPTVLAIDEETFVRGFGRRATRMG